MLEAQAQSKEGLKAVLFSQAPLCTGSCFWGQRGGFGSLFGLGFRVSFCSGVPQSVRATRLVPSVQ